jgi:hypothetical protein
MKTSSLFPSYLFCVVPAIVAQAAGCASAADPQPAADAAGLTDVAGLTVGKTCVPDGGGAACAAGLSCVKQTSGDVAHCDILLQVMPGACCQQHVDCPPGRICESGVCIPNRTGRCSTTDLYGGAMCWQDHECEPDSTAAGGHCVGAPQPKALGEECKDQSECGLDAFCNGHCTTLSGEGGPCTAEPNGVGCKPGYGCDVTNTCHLVCIPK